MLRAIAALLLVLAVFAPSAQAEDDIWRAGAAVSVNAQGEPDVWAAGASVTVRGEAARDIWAAGAIVDIDAQAGTDIWAAGSRVNIAGRVGEALNVTGAEVDITARVGGESRVAGARVTFTPEAVLNGKVRAAGALVDFRGRGGDVSLSGAEVTFNGQTTGDVVIRGQKVQVADEAEIGGNLEIYSNERPDIAQQARIGGRLVTLGLEDADWPEGDGFPAILAALIAPVIFAISAFILGLLAIWLARGAVEQTIDTFMERPGGSLLRGIFTLLAVFVGAAVLVALFVGFPLGIAALFAVPVLIITGLASAGLSLGEWIANRAGEPLSASGRIGLMALGVLVLTLVGLIPIAGAVLVLLAIVMGLGAAVITVLARLRPETPPTGY
jgi:Ca2+/Na+ antiporter